MFPQYTIELKSHISLYAITYVKTIFRTDGFHCLSRGFFCRSREWRKRFTCTLICMKARVWIINQNSAYPHINAGYSEKEVDDPYDGNMQTTSWMSVEGLPMCIKTIKIKTRTMWEHHKVCDTSYMRPKSVVVFHFCTCLKLRLSDEQLLI